MSEGGLVRATVAVPNAANDALALYGSWRMPSRFDRRHPIPPERQTFLTTTTDSPSVAFVGLGIMGGHMARHILDAGHPLHVSTRTRAKAEPLLAAGAVWHDTPGEAAAGADIVISIVGHPHDVEAVYLGTGGIVERARPGAVLIDMTTSSPSLAIRIAEAARARGLHALDAPVSGGDVGARDAKLTIMVGGDEEAFAKAEPVLRRMGQSVSLLGGPGAGQHTKLCNQIVIAGTVSGVAEGLAYAERVGLDAARVLETIGKGAAGSFQLQVLGPRMVAGDYAPGFMIEHFLKDLTIATDESSKNGLDLTVLETVRRLFSELAEVGQSRAGTQAIISRHRAK